VRVGAERKQLTGPACTEALNEAEEAKGREGAEGNAGGVRVERRVRPARRAIVTEPLLYQSRVVGVT
jgi:hypothetical protein